MAFAKRTMIFLGVNALILVTLSVTLNLLGVGHYFTARGIDFRSLLVFCLVWGMGGAFISLALSRVMAKWMMGVKVIDPNTSDPALRELVATVHRLACPRCPRWVGPPAPRSTLSPPAPPKAAPWWPSPPACWSAWTAPRWRACWATR